MSGFWAFFWWIFAIFAFAAYLFVIFTIITDLFRDRKMSGWGKAAWVIFLIIFPIITSLVYLIARGGGMAERAQADAMANKAMTDEYIRQTAGTSTPADQIATAKSLLDSGAIDQKEFDHLKAKALA